MVKAPIWRQIVDSFERWLSLPNYDVVEIVAAVVLANRLPGEPLWLALVGPSSSGKTEVIRALETVERVHQVDHFTTSTLASGYKPGRSERGESNGSVAEYGLLEKMMDDEPHIITIGDFSTILGKRYELRNEIMNQLRRLYDGSYDASFGNGVLLQWRGKCGVMVCSTGVYDREMGTQSVFGDRFLVCRSIPGDAETIAERAGRNSSESKKMREELRKAFKKLDSLRVPKKEQKLSLDARTMVAKLCSFVAQSRTPVPRDSKSREVVAKPEIEGTGRMSAQLHQLLRGLLVLKGRTEVSEDEIELVERVAFGTVPSLRMDILRSIDVREGTAASELRNRTSIPKSVLQRTLEDLDLLDVLYWEENPGSQRSGKWFVHDAWRPMVYRTQATDPHI